ncbi:MAG: SurA N-terminal domain-containing protein, partial [Azovibrio sp.]
LVEALFVESVIKEGHNAEVVEVAPGVIVAARMLEHKPASVLPLDQVKSMIEAGLRQEKAVALAVKQGEEKLAALKAGKAEEKNWGKVRSVSRLTPDGIPPSNLSAIFRVNAAALPGYAGAELPGMGYGLYKVSKTELVQAGKDEIEGLKEMQKGMVAQAEQKAYMEALRERNKIKINEERLQLNEEKEQEQQ